MTEVVPKLCNDMIKPIEEYDKFTWQNGVLSFLNMPPITPKGHGMSLGNKNQIRCPEGP